MNTRPEAVKDKDRNAARAWTSILARAGYEIQRNPRREQVARAIHERHRADRAAAGETQSTNPILVLWDKLSAN